MGTVPAIAQELAVSVPADDVPKYLAVLRTHKENAKPDERLSKTIARIGFADFKKGVEAKLELHYDDIIQTAKGVREKKKC